MGLCAATLPAQQPLAAVTHCEGVVSPSHGCHNTCTTSYHQKLYVYTRAPARLLNPPLPFCPPQQQDKIVNWIHNGKWQEIVAEKRSVLTSMQQVLQSCHALLDSTQVPMDSIVKLLQHILR